MKLTETDIKYLSGLMDADGSMFFHFMPYNGRWNVTLKLVLQQSFSIDKDGKFMEWLSSYGGNLQYIPISKDNPNWSDAYRVTFNPGTGLKTLLPRLTKHMVIKAKHWQALFDKYISLESKNVSEQEMEELKEFSKISRKNTGPLKPKKHPTWAWVAGYLDGDGCYYMRKRKKNWGIATELLVAVVATPDDRCSLDLLQKAFNGTLKPTSRQNTLTWTRNLGNRDVSFAVPFLKKMVNHSRLKKHKIETMLHHHSQRLSEINAEA